MHLATALFFHPKIETLVIIFHILPNFRFLKFSILCLFSCGYANFKLATHIFFLRRLVQKLSHMIAF